MGRKRQRRNQVRKRGVFPRFILSGKGGYETVWRYRKWTIEVEKYSDTEYSWSAFHPDATKPYAGNFQMFEGKLTGPTGETEQDALWIAKYWIDRWELFWSTRKKKGFDDAAHLIRAVNVLESRAQMIAEGRSRSLTRATLAREWQSIDPRRAQLPERGKLAWDYFQSLPVKKRTAIIDDVVAYTKRASWWEILTPAEQRKRGGGQFKNKASRPKKNPDRTRAIMRSFMRL